MITLQSIPLAAGLLATALLTSVVSGQNVGIGTTTPKSKLSVNGSTASGGIAVGDATYTSTTGTVAPINGAIIQGFTGIGTPAPAALLHVLDGNILRSNTDGTASAIITSGGGIELFREGPSLPVPYTNGYIDFKDAVTDDLDARIFYYKGVAGQAPPFDAGDGLGFLASATTTPQMLLETGTGELGIGTLSPRTKLEVAGIATVSSGSFPTAVNCMSIAWNSGGLKPGQGVGEFVNYAGTGGGNGYDFYRLSVGTPTLGHLIASITAAGAYVQVSDKRTKTDVQTLRYGLKEVMALEAKEYDFHPPSSFEDGKVSLSETRVHQMGFLAQDAMLVVPEAVEKPQDPAKGLYTMNYAGLMPVVVKAVQELKQQQDEKLTRQDARIAALEAENGKLRVSNTQLSSLASELSALKEVVSSMRSKDGDVVLAK